MCPSAAVEANESFLSEMNREQRLNMPMYNVEMIQSIEDMQRKSFRSRGNNLPENFDRPDVRVVRCQLQGPHNPLEFKLAAVDRQGTMKMCSVEPGSVNSVLLDRYPLDSHCQWLVAGHVGMTSTGEQLLLRSTTMLPNQHGLGHLLTMVFAPFVEMRCDKKRKKYTGFIAGLGFRESDWGRSSRTGARSNCYGGAASSAASSVSRGGDKKMVAYYPEKDMDLLFDVEVDNDDVMLVNKIRYWINYSLLRRSFGSDDQRQRRRDERDHQHNQHNQRTESFLPISSNPEQLLKVQQSLQSNIRQLLDRPRKSQTPQRRPDVGEYHWRKLPPAKYLYAAEVDMEENNKYFLKMINGIVLKGEEEQLQRQQERDEEVSRVARLLEDLDLLHEMGKKDLCNLQQFCPICPASRVLRDSQDIWNHIKGRRHQEMYELATAPLDEDDHREG